MSFVSKFPRLISLRGLNVISSKLCVLLALNIRNKNSVNLKENGYILAELLAVKISPQNYPRIPCGRGFYAKTRLTFNR